MRHKLSKTVRESHYTVAFETFLRHLSKARTSYEIRENPPWPKTSATIPVLTLRTANNPPGREIYFLVLYVSLYMNEIKEVTVLKKNCFLFYILDFGLVLQKYEVYPEYLVSGNKWQN